MIVGIYLNDRGAGKHVLYGCIINLCTMQIPELVDLELVIFDEVLV